MLGFKSVLVLVGVVLGFEGAFGATTTYQSHRTTSLDELKSIDGLVSSGLPLFGEGFFISTAHGPVLVKAKSGDNKKKPGLNPGYYSTLPRLIPQGYEGIAVSHFNLGTAVPSQLQQQQHQAISNNNNAYSSRLSHQIQHPSDASSPYSGATSHSSSNIFYQSQQAPQYQSSQVQYENPQPQIQYQNSQPQQIQYQSPQPQPQLQYPRSQPQIQYRSSQPQIQYQQQPSQYQYQPEQYQQQAYQPVAAAQAQEQYLRQVQPEVGPPQQRQQRFLAQQPRSRAISPVAQDSFQVDNLLTPNSDHVATSYMNMEFGHQSLPSQRHQRNPTVEQTLAYEDTLPENLKNPFYRDEQLATALAQESLPVQGEEVVGEWDTTKIQKAKIQELLRGAGFIN